MIFRFKVKLPRTTTEELADLFKKEGVSSSDTIRKCVTFFSLAAKDAGIKLSPHIKPYAGARRPSRRRSASSAGITESAEPSKFPVVLEQNSSEWELLLSKFPNFDPSWSDDLVNRWLIGFERLSKICHEREKDSPKNRL